jgi:hypothetical protein
LVEVIRKLAGNQELPLDLLARAHTLDLKPRSTEPTKRFGERR